MQSSISNTENVWDYPRPPALEPVPDRIRVIIDNECVADSTASMRILETSHPPVYYLRSTDVLVDRLVRAPGGSICEWKGRASYWTYQTPKRTIESLAWSYPSITGRYAAIEGYLAFYPSKVDECWIGETRAAPQEGDFYGGWITPNLKGPFKGGPATLGW